MDEPGELTVLLQQAESGDVSAANQLYVLVEQELRAIAAARKNRTANELSMSTTYLVDEAFLRVVGNNKTDWRPGDRRRFYSWVSIKIHDLMIDSARKKKAMKRGGDNHHVAIESDLEGGHQAQAFNDVLIDLQGALDRFQAFAPDEAAVFRIRTFLNCTYAEIAERLEMSETRVKGCFARAQHWVQNELRVYRDDA
ncbi:MAG: ECF-type sigma factor [Gemmataceae bacterium]